MNAPITIGVLGAGAWGTALALALADNGRRVQLWGHDPAALATIARERCNRRYLPDIPLPDTVDVTADLSALAHADGLLVAVPSHAFRATVAAVASVSQHPVLAWATKGFEPGSGKLLSEVVADTWPGRAYGVVSGPTFAGEVARGLPSALTVAATTPEAAATIAGWLHSDRLRVYTNSDLPGVQLGGAIKNVMAIAAGISDGLGFGANARAALITRGLAELARLGTAMGGSRETFMGLAGAGDLILTCTDNASRNRRVGLGLGRGQPLAAVLAAIGQEAEGVATARELYRLALSLGIDMPITEQVYRVLYDGLSPQAAVEALLTREPRAELR